MSLKAILWAMEQNVLSSSKKFVLIALANFCGDAGKSYPGIQSICKITSLHEDTVRKSLESLVDDHIITETGETTGGTGRIKVYQLPECCIEIPRKTGVLKMRSIPEQSLFNTPPNTRIIPDSVGSPNIMEQGTGNREQVVRFKKPTIEEVKLEAAKIALPEIEAEKFLCHFESNGWHVGRVPMKSWPHALQNWKHNYEIYAKRNGTYSQGARQVADRNRGTLNNPSDYAGIKSC